MGDAQGTVQAQSADVWDELYLALRTGDLREEQLETIKKLLLSVFRGLPSWVQDDAVQEALTLIWNDVRSGKYKLDISRLPTYIGSFIVKRVKETLERNYAQYNYRITCVTCGTVYTRRSRASLPGNCCGRPLLDQPERVPMLAIDFWDASDSDVQTTTEDAALAAINAQSTERTLADFLRWCQRPERGRERISDRELLAFAIRNRLRIRNGNLGSTLRPGDRDPPAGELEVPWELVATGLASTVVAARKAGNRAQNKIEHLWSEYASEMGIASL